MFTVQNSHCRPIVFLLVCFLLLFSLGSAPAPPVQTKPDVPNSPDYLPLSWNALPNQDFFDGYVTALVASGTDIYVGRSAHLTCKGHVSRYNLLTNTWHELPNQGFNCYVKALVVMGDDLYVGGEFTATGDGSLKDLGGIARYDIKTGKWHRLNNNGIGGAYPWVSALAVSGDILYVGGVFSATGDGSMKDLVSIARYNTTNGTWSGLTRRGLSGFVYALALSGDDLFVGGVFDQTGDLVLKDLGNIARYDTNTNTWYALPQQGLNDRVNALEMYGDDLYVGGDFVQTGDRALKNLGRIARYDTQYDTWHALPNQGVRPGPNGAASVRALEMSGSDLYVGGALFGTADGSIQHIGNILRYNTTTDTWHALPNQGLNDYVYALEASGGEIFVGGTFNKTVDWSLKDLDGIARLQTAAGTWRALPLKGMNDTIRALALSEDDLYAGGDFNQSGDGSLKTLGNIARYNITTNTWFPLAKGLDGTVHALAVSGDNLYVGGEFTATGDGNLNNLGGVARYDMKAGKWFALPRQGLNGTVYVLEAFRDNLYAGGAFTGTVDSMLNNLGNIARYDPAANEWYAMPNQGFNSYVYALEGSGENLYVGGAFTGTIDTSLQELGGISRYNTTDGKWHSLPNKGINGTARALEMLGDDLYVAGFFAQTGDTSVKNLGNIARYNTKDGKWYALPNQGLNYWIFALDVLGHNLYVGGWFSRTGDKTLQDLGNLARYDSNTGKWHPLANKGVDYIVLALEVFGNDLYATGYFSKTGDGILKDLGNIARHDLEIPGIPGYLPLVYK